MHQLIQLADRFEQVRSIILVHFSARYSPEELSIIIDRKVSEPFRSKLKLGRHSRSAEDPSTSSIQ